jgi:hypothetical protein
LVLRVHAGPPKMDCQPFGGSRPSVPRPGRNQKRSRAVEPGPFCSASTNQGCAVEQWFGTTSTMTRMPSLCASPISSSASASVPNTGSIARWSATS